MGGLGQYFFMKEKETEYPSYKSIPRLYKKVVITEKVDGTNAVIQISPNGEMKVGSRNRWLTLGDDNFGFAKWAFANKKELLKLGEGTWYGEWFGEGIQRTYGLNTKHLALFRSNLGIKGFPDNDKLTDGVVVEWVPVLYEGKYEPNTIKEVMEKLSSNGSEIVKGFKDPEGIVIFFEELKKQAKVTLEGDKSKFELNKKG